jgi:hypothetical protein
VRSTTAELSRRGISALEVAYGHCPLPIRRPGAAGELQAFEFYRY